MALKPASITFEEAAAVRQAAFTALQGLRDKGQIQSGQKALKLEPFSPLAHYELALVYWQQDKKEEAMEHLKTALYVWEEADTEYKPAKEARKKLAEWEWTICT